MRCKLRRNITQANGGSGVLGSVGLAQILDHDTMKLSRAILPAALLFVALADEDLAGMPAVLPGG